jgi:hypothetical protein
MSTGSVNLLRASRSLTGAWRVNSSNSIPTSSRNSAAAALLSRLLTALPHPRPLQHSRQDFDDKGDACHSTHRHDDQEYDSANHSDNLLRALSASFLSQALSFVPLAPLMMGWVSSISRQLISHFPTLPCTFLIAL